MEDKLAKQLKDAGFPFDWERKCPECGEEGSHRNCPSPHPTLSELIEACGKPFALKVHEDGEWFAANDTEGFACKAGYGKTPEEAVAMLWLELKNS